MRKLAYVSATVLALGASLVAAPAANAAGRDGRCQSGEFCYYHNSNNQGSVSDFTGSVGDYGTTQPSCYEYKGPGNGQGTCIKNDAASVWNRTGKKVRVYYNSNYDGSRHHQDFAPGAKKNLNATMKNNNASHKIGVSSLGCTTDGTNTTPPSSILVYRVDAGRVDRVSFKQYVKNVLPNEWISTWPRASLRAGAMAVKSYGWYWALHSTRDTPWGACYDVRDDVGDQVYAPGSARTPTSNAVDATWGTRMTRSGAILQAHYCSTSTRCPAWQTGNWMSQYGSRDLAVNGHSWQYILRRYYSSISLS